MIWCVVMHWVLLHLRIFLSHFCALLVVRVHLPFFDRHTVWKRTSPAVWLDSCRVQRADEAATVVLVCVERPRHNNWFTVRPLSRRKSADLRTVSLCVCTLNSSVYIKKTDITYTLSAPIFTLCFLACCETSCFWTCVLFLFLLIFFFFCLHCWLMTPDTAEGSWQ